MTVEARYYIWREPCWGGTHKWAVFERVSKPPWKRVSRWFDNERAANRHRDRMEIDHVRYAAAMRAKG